MKEPLSDDAAFAMTTVICATIVLVELIAAATIIFCITRIYQ